MQTKAQTKRVTLFGGPLDGRQVEVARADETYLVGTDYVFWTYEYAGKADGKEQFAIRPNTGIARRFIRWYVGKFGRDPRIETQLAKPKPVTNTGRVAHGRGAAKRAARKAA